MEKETDKKVEELTKNAKTIPSYAKAPVGDVGPRDLRTENEREIDNVISGWDKIKNTVKSSFDKVTDEPQNKKFIEGFGKAWKKGGLPTPTSPTKVSKDEMH